MLVSEDIFFACVNKINAIIPFEQTLAWKQYKTARNVSFLYFIDNVEDPHQACWGRVYKKVVVGKILDINGNVQTHDVTRKMITGFFKSIIDDADANMICFNGIDPYNVETEIGIRCAGFVRPLGNRICPLTQIVDVTAERDFDRNWKRNLKKANQNNLLFQEVVHPTQQDALLFSHLFDELKERKALGYSVDNKAIMYLLSSTDYKLYTVSKDEKVLCARIVYINKNHAEDVFAANSFDSMNYSATHFIMEKIFADLKEKGVKLFDFSRIPPSAGAMNSVYLFKKSAGGYPMQYLGEWIWTKKYITSLLFCIYNFFIHRGHNF